MGLWQKAKDFLTTDIEVAVTQRPEAKYVALREDTRLGGAISRVSDDERVRCIFHHGFPLNMSYVLLHCEPDKSVITIYRTGAGSVTVFTSHESAAGWETKRRHLRVEIGEPLVIQDGLGRPITVKRVRHRDFVLFPR